MKILFNDIIQELSDVPAPLKSPALSDAADISGSLTITFPKPVRISAVGIGNTDATYFSITSNNPVSLSTESGFYLVTESGAYLSKAGGSAAFDFDFADNGLYAMPHPVTAKYLIIQTDATFIGRFAAGLAVDIPTSVAKQPGWNSTAEPRTTLSGQVIPGAGGYNYRTLSLDSRYKMGREAFSEIEKGFKYIGQGYPFFIDLAEESYKLPYSRLYATENNQRSMGFEGGVRKFLYSRRWEFREAF